MSDFCARAINAQSVDNNGGTGPPAGSDVGRNRGGEAAICFAASRTSGHLPGRLGLCHRPLLEPPGVSSDPGRGSGDSTGGMFRGLSNWLGLGQPETAAQQSEEGGSPPKVTPLELGSQAVEEPQQAGDQELLHQAKGIGSECLRGPGGSERRGAPSAQFWTGWVGGEGRNVCRAVL